MGILSDEEIEFEDPPVGADVNTPPGSPTLRASRAQALAENFATGPSELAISDTRAARNFAALCCEEFGLTDADKDEVLRTSQMSVHFALICLYTRTVSLTRTIQRTAIETFLSSPEFKDHITCRVQATFLDHDLPCYVRGSTSRLIQHMQENPASWRIPAVIRTNLVTTKAFWKAVGAIASNFRGDMRRKIKKSIIDKSDIGALASKLCVKGYQPTRDHWRRFALLRIYMLDWEKIPLRRGTGRPLSYWAFIDSKLDKFRDVCTRASPTETNQVMKEKLKANLRNDEKQFPGPSSGKTQLPARVLVPEWQKDHARAVIRMSTYVVDGSPDDDLEDDEGAGNGGSPNTTAGGSRIRNSEDGEDAEDGDDESDTRRGSVTSNHNASEVGSSTNAGQLDRNAPPSRLPAPEPPQGSQAEPRAPLAPRILVPETQQVSPSTSPARQVEPSQSSLPLFVPETQYTNRDSQSRTGSLANGGTQTTQSGWAGGSLVNRHAHTPHRALSPIAQPVDPPQSTRQLRIRRG